jgi:hypothetical protein
MPFSGTQPGGIAGHGVPSGRTHAWSKGPAAAGVAQLSAIPRATAPAPQISRYFLIGSCLFCETGLRYDLPEASLQQTPG